METEIEPHIFIFEDFKKQLSHYIKSNFKTCEQFHNSLLSTKDEKELKGLFKDYKDEVFEYLGGDIDYLISEETDILDGKIDRLECDIEDLEDKLYELGIGDKRTWHDELKIQYFMEYKDKYTPFELEELLKDGKNYNKINLLEETIDDLEYEIIELKEKINELE